MTNARERKRSLSRYTKGEKERERQNGGREDWREENRDMFLRCASAE